MIDVYNLIDKVKKYYAFDSTEIRWLLISIPLLAFIAGFNDGRPQFEVVAWTTNLLLCMVAVVIAMFVHESAHRVIGLEQGYKTTFKPMPYGLIAGLILSFMSYGKIIFLAYGGVFLNIIEKHRLGYFRYQLGYFHHGAVSIAGPLANTVTAILFSTMTFIPSPLLHKIVLINLLFAVTNMLPVPGVDGLHVLYASRMLYFLSYGAMVGIMIFLLKGFAWWVVILAALLTALVFWFGFYFVIEKKLM